MTHAEAREKCEWCGLPVSRLLYAAVSKLSGREYGFCSDKCHREFVGYVPMRGCGNHNVVYGEGDFDSWGRTVRQFEDRDD